uniref:Kinesin-associated protein n=1 Tax=Panagrellus redivivus TaxID=6233 RepID=A0A7E4ZWP1_PANRE
MLTSFHTDEEDMTASQITRGLDIEAHPTELAIIVKYGLRRDQKNIYLKDLTPSVDPTVVARFVIDKCPLIPIHRAPDVEQVIHFLQKRSPSTNSNATDAFFGNKTTASVATLNAKLEELDSYIDMLYEDTEKSHATGLILNLTNNPSNLRYFVDNEVLMQALTRVFREDSKKNFQLATNIAIVFLRMSGFAEFQPVISHYKIGALSMQLIENELKRWEIWKNEAKGAVDKAKKKWEFAIQRQDELVSILMQLLQNLAEDVRVENKMVKRGILPMLIKCLEHSSVELQVAAVNFMWKLSIFVENKDAMAASGVVEKLVELFPTNSSALANAVFSLLFNLSFDSGLRKKMVSAGLVPFVAPYIEENSTALSLLYQLSMLDDAKTMITFTDAIPILMRMVASNSNKIVVKGCLINAALEKRNAQLICSPDGRGLDMLMQNGFNDILCMKICRNIASHEGPTQALFGKHIKSLLNFVKENSADTKGPNFVLAMECLGTVAQITATDWAKQATELNLINWLETHLEAATAMTNLIIVPDDFLLQIVILVGSMAQNFDAARMILPLVPLLTKLLEKRHEDDEIVLQIVYAFYCMLGHNEINEILCNEDGTFVECLISLMHDPNQQLRNMCDQALQFIAESNEHWRERVSEERFRFHNAQWIEMISGGADSISDIDSFESFNNIVLDADELLDVDQSAV